MSEPVVTPTVAATAPVLGTPEYDAAMVAKFDASKAPVAEPLVVDTPAVPTRPDSIPEKFWDAEKGEVRLDALVKSYSELEKTKGTKVVPPVVEPTVAPVDAPAVDAAAAALEAKGFDYNVLATEFMEHGDITEETRKALEAKGFTKEVVDSHIAGQHALAREWDNTGYEVAGGKESFDRMATWAATNLTKQEALALNDAFNGPQTNVDKMKLAVAGLRAKYEGANGKAPGLLGGQPHTGGAGYESRAQMTADMKDPKYDKDPAFRASVERKLAATTAF